MDLMSIPKLWVTEEEEDLKINMTVLEKPTVNNLTDTNRRKSILKCSEQNSSIPAAFKLNGKRSDLDLNQKKFSTASSIVVTIAEPEYDKGNKGRSWYYRFCLKCRDEESSYSWEPVYWPKFCPYPFCPSYRQFARIVCFILIGLLTWCILYSVLGDTAMPPKGQLFVIIFISITSYLVGSILLTVTTLPALIGMLFTGLFLQNVGIVDVDESFMEITGKIRTGALAIILIRAGLDLDPKAFWRLKYAVLKLGIIPWIVEAIVVAVSVRYLLDMTWNFSIILGSIICAVSPAVVVPCLFRLRTKGYGVAKGIPTLIIAVAGVDDALSVAGFGIVKSIIFSHSSVVGILLQGPGSICGGIIFGVLLGWLLNYTPERYDVFVVPLRVIMLLVGGMGAIYLSDYIGYAGAGPLGAITAAFVALYFWSKQGWDVEENPAATAFEIFWLIMQPALFGITGAQIKFNELQGSVVLTAIGIVFLGAVIRIFTTTLVGIGCKLNLKEKIFCAISWMPKATVQAALAPVVLAEIHDVSSKEYKYAKDIVVVCVISIITTTSLGATLVTILGTKLLRKTKPIEPTEWRRAHRPSVRDISIAEEDEESLNENSDETTADTVDNQAGVDNLSFKE